MPPLKDPLWLPETNFHKLWQILMITTAELNLALDRLILMVSLLPAACCLTAKVDNGKTDPSMNFYVYYIGQCFELRIGLIYENNN